MDKNNERYKVLYEEESLVVNVIDDLLAVLENKNISLTELSKRLGISRDDVEKLFRGDKLTVREVARVAHAMGVKAYFKIT